MLRSSVRMQMNALFKKKSTVIIYFILLFLVLLNFYLNLKRYHGWDVRNMYQPMRLLLLAEQNEIGYYFMQYLPILAVIPAAFSYFSDRNSKELLFIQTRLGSKPYYYGKLISVFCVTFLVFTLPFLIEIFLNVIAFPIKADGNLTNFSIYSDTYAVGVESYLLKELFFISPYLYAIFFTVIFGVTTGLLAVFAMAVSTFESVKYKILVFLPLYLVLYMVNLVGYSILRLDVTTNYMFYLFIFDGATKNGYFYLVFMALLFLVTIILVNRKAKKDNLL